MSGSLKHNIISGFAWQYIQRIGDQMIHFIVSLVLARLLMPEDFGTVALLGVFIAISNIFVDSGFGNALIQRKEIDDIDTSSVFYLNIVISIIIYSIVFLCAPFVSIFYGMPQLTALLRVLSIQVVIMSFGCVQQSMLVRQMKFKFKFYIGMISVIVSSTIGIGMAYSGMGVWSIVLSQTAAQLCTCVGLWYFVAWRPKWAFSWERIKSLFSYGSRILGGSIVNVIYNNIYNLVIGKRYSSSDLGFYNRGQLLPTTVIDTVSTSFNSVLFPALSSIQDDKVRYKSLIRKSAKMISFVVFFLAALMLVFSPQIIRLLLGEKWLSAVPFMCIVCCTVCINPLIVINQTISTSLGKSDFYMKTTIASKFIAIGLIAIGSLYSVYMMVIAGAVANILTLLITARYNNPLIGYTYKEMLQDYVPSLLLSALACGLSIFIVSFIPVYYIIGLIIGGLLSVFLYLIMAYVTKQESLTYIQQMFRKQ